MHFLEMVEGLEECPLPRARTRVNYQGRGAAVLEDALGILLSFRHRLFLPLFELLGVRIRYVGCKVSYRALITLVPDSYTMISSGKFEGGRCRCLRGLASWGRASWRWRWRAEGVLERDAANVDEN